MRNASARARPSTQEVVDRNEVVLVGRLAAAPESRVLPSGDEITTFRLVVRRIPVRVRPEQSSGSPRGPGSRGQVAGRTTVDTLDCTGWRADVRRSLRSWAAGDVVEVTGALRRRFFRSPGGPASRYDVEVASVRRLRRGDG